MAVGINIRILVCSLAIGFLRPRDGVALVVQGHNILPNANSVKIGATDAVRSQNRVGVDSDFQPHDPNVILRSGIIDPALMWGQRTVVYEIDKNFPEPFKATFMKAMNHISGRTCIQFKERMNEVAYVRVHQGDDCSSIQGRLGSRQDLSLGLQCGDIGIHIRHLIHTIGFGFEHRRWDRDEYVIINETNVDASNLQFFQKYSDITHSPFSVPYDYSSIMHFKSNYLSKNGLDTIKPRQVGAVIGEAQALSDLDIKKINNMYCSGSLGMRIRSCYDGSYLDVKGGLSGEGKEVVLSKLGSQDSQKWTANWLDLLNAEKGSTFANWAQDGGRLKVLDEDEVSGLISTWGYAAGYRNQLWSLEQATASPASVQKRYRIKNMSSGRCLSAPMTRCSGLTLLEFIFKKLVYNSCKGGQSRSVTCNSDEPKQLWNIDFV